MDFKDYVERYDRLTMLSEQASEQESLISAESKHQERESGWKADRISPEKKKDTEVDKTLLSTGLSVGDFAIYLRYLIQDKCAKRPAELFQRRLNVSFA